MCESSRERARESEYLRVSVRERERERESVCVCTRCDLLRATLILCVHTHLCIYSNMCNNYPYRVHAWGETLRGLVSSIEV